MWGSRALYHFQFMFINLTLQLRAPKQTVLTTYILTTKSLSAFNNKLLVGGIFYAPEKAFNCVTHNILLAKLKFY